MGKVWKVVLALILLLLAAFGVWAILSPAEKYIYNTTDIKMMQASVVGKEQGDDGLYLQVDVPGMSGSPYYVQISQEFYQKASTGNQVGVVLGYVDTYRAKPSFDKLKLNIEYASSAYEVLSVYPSLSEAQKENQPVSFTTRATLKQRIKSDDFRYYFLMDAGGKKIMAEVSKEYYDRFPPASTGENFFELQFSGLGDFNQLVGIINPK